MADFDPTSGGGLVASLVGGLAAALTAWRIGRVQSSGDSLTRASNAANVEAIDTYKELVAELRAALKIEKERSDKFAEERNEALKEMFEIKGQVGEMARQLAANATEIASLRSTIQRLQEAKQ